MPSSDETRSDKLTIREFLPLAIQLALVLSLAYVFRIEQDSSFHIIALMVFIVFVVLPWIAARYRLPFILLLTAITATLLVGTSALWLFATGIVFISVCHLPAAWKWRVLLVAGLGVVLTLVQLEYVKHEGIHAVIPILAAMFMFRIILYLNDLKVERTPATISQRLTYFFLLPNLSFPLFPVIDYKTFVRSYYDAPAAQIYQKGIYWIHRGVLHLLLYRLVYYALPRADSDLDGIFGVYVFMAMTYGLYMRVSGLFHIIIGIVCLFGFDLPRTNNHYFLASSFTDLWRRINIYWKDFMMTIVFYPAFLGLRRLPMTLRLASATVAVFVVTWFLHSYQWFWLEGVFPVTLTDIIFWGVLGIALTANSLWEARQGRRRVLGKQSWSLRAASVDTLKALSVFSFMAVLWTLWDSASVTEWAYRLLRVRESDPMHLGFFVALVGLAFLSAVLVQWLGSRGMGLKFLEETLWKRAAWTVSVSTLVLLFVSSPQVHVHLGGQVTRVVLKTKATIPNRLDMESRQRGYYETLTRSSPLAFGEDGPRNDLGWVGFRETDAAVNTSDIRSVTLAPSLKRTLKGASFSTNQWGMRDKEYTKDKPPGVYRLALLGSSQVMGVGVDDEQTFDARLEATLSTRSLVPDVEKYEVLNFAVGGYGLIQELYVARHITPEFEPDVVLCFIHPGEAGWMIERLRSALSDGAQLDRESAYVGSILEAARAGKGLPEAEFKRRVAPYASEMLRWALSEMADAIRTQGASPVFVLLPHTEGTFSQNELRSLTEAVQSVGATSIVLADVYANYDSDELKIAAWDDHPNDLGHHLIAEALIVGLESVFHGRTP